MSLERDEEMDLFNLAKLISFSGEISRRLIAFSNKIDEAPSSIKSAGYEIRSTADVLSELHTVLAKQQNERISSFSVSAVEGLTEAVEKCDEIIFEVARGVLVAHERMKKLPMIDGKVTLGIKERASWPLFQLRLYTLVRDLSAAKMDIVTYLLILQIRTERFYGKRIQSVLFASLNRDQSEEIIARLWQAKTARDSDQAALGMGVLPFRSTLRDPGLRNIANSQSEVDSSDDDMPSPTRKQRRNFFRRFTAKLSQSSSKPSSSVHGSQQSKDAALSRTEDAFRTNPQARNLMRASSSLSSKSVSDLCSVASSSRSHISSVSSKSSVSSVDANQLLQKRMSIFSLTGTMPSAPEAGASTAKRSMPKHGPTMAAKRGIEQEWEAFRTLGEWEQGTGAEEQRLGQQLLLGQLLAKSEVYGQDTLPAHTVVEMLVTRWTTVPRRDTIVSSPMYTLPRLQTDVDAIPQVPSIPLGIGLPGQSLDCMRAVAAS